MVSQLVRGIANHARHSDGRASSFDKLRMKWRVRIGALVRDVGPETANPGDQQIKSDDEMNQPGEQKNQKTGDHRCPG